VRSEAADAPPLWGLGWVGCKLNANMRGPKFENPITDSYSPPLSIISKRGSSALASLLNQSIIKLAI